MLAIGWIFLHYQSLSDEGNIYQSRGKSINRRIDEFFARACVERYSGQRPGTMKGDVLHVAHDRWKDERKGRLSTTRTVVTAFS